MCKLWMWFFFYFLFPNSQTTLPGHDHVRIPISGLGNETRNATKKKTKILPQTSLRQPALPMYISLGKSDNCDLLQSIPGRLLPSACDCIRCTCASAGNGCNRAHTQLEFGCSIRQIMSRSIAMGNQLIAVPRSGTSIIQVVYGVRYCIV